MPRGGKREGAGAKPKWKHGKTKLIRVPVALADQVLELTEMLDNGYEVGRLDIIETVTKSDKVIDLSGISLTHLSGVLAVKLEDLVSSGYKLLPEAISVTVEARFKKLRRDRSFVGNGNH